VNHHLRLPPTNLKIVSCDKNSTMAPAFWDKLVKHIPDLFFNSTLRFFFLRSVCASAVISFVLAPLLRPPMAGLSVISGFALVHHGAR
jgi:hypothetical protein